MHQTIHTRPPALNTECEPRTAMNCDTYQPRYVAFLRDGGRITGTSMNPFMSWVMSRSAQFRKENGLHRFAPLPEPTFSRWLDEKTQRYADCHECFGDGHWHGERCHECDGTGVVPDVCHFNVWGCRPDPCLTDDEWAALKLSRSLRVDWNQDFEEVA